MNSEARTTASRPVVVTSTKSVGIQILLVVFLGPLGLFYSTIIGALTVLFGVPVAAIVLGAATSLTAARGAGLGTMIALTSEVVLTILAWWVGSLVWGIIAVNAYNRRLLRSA